MISLSTLAQKAITIKDALKTFGFTEQKVISNSDTITYYLKNPGPGARCAEKLRHYI
jgi:hypothetical protein